MPSRTPFASLALLAIAPTLALGQSTISSDQSSTPAADAHHPRPSDQTRPTQAETEADKRFTIELRPRVEHTFDGDLRDSEGSVSVTRAGGGLGLSFAASKQLIILVNADAEYSCYDWSDVGDLLPSGEDPIKNAYTARFTPGIVYALNETWSLTGGGIIELSGETGADLSDSITYGGFFGARYKVSDSLGLTFGVIAKTRLEDDAIAVPLLGVRWQINDKLSLENEGLGLKLITKINEQWRASIFGRFELRDYRLDDDNSIPEGVLRDTRVPVGLGIEWRPNPRVSVSLTGGATVYQKFTFDDANGDQIESDRTRPTPFIGLSASFAF
jgi:hypothetical protein